MLLCLEGKLGQLELSVGTTCNLELLFDVLAGIHSLFPPFSISSLICMRGKCSRRIPTHSVDVSESVSMPRLVKLQLVVHVDSFARDGTENELIAREEISVEESFQSQRYLRRGGQMDEAILDLKTTCEINRESEGKVNDGRLTSRAVPVQL